MTEQIIENNTDNQPNGLSGWLTLIGLGLILGPFKMLYFFYSIYQQIFIAEVWEYLTTPESVGFIKYFTPMLMGEILFNALLLIALIYTGYLYFSKRKEFPKWYIGIIVFSVAFIVLDAFVVSWIVPDTKVFDSDTLKDLARSLLLAFIWIPYMRVSKRVKNTFVN